MFGCIQDTLVVVVDNLFSVIHATVADLDGIAVEDFSEFVLFREVFGHCLQSSVIIIIIITLVPFYLCQQPR